MQILQQASGETPAAGGDQDTAKFLPDSFTFGKKNIPEANQTDTIDRDTYQDLNIYDNTQKKPNVETFGKSENQEKVGESDLKGKDPMDTYKLSTRDDGFDPNQETLGQTEKKAIDTAIKNDDQMDDQMKGAPNTNDKEGTREENSEEKQRDEIQ